MQRGRVRHRLGVRAAGWLAVASGLGWLLGLALQLQQPMLWPAMAHAGLVLVALAAGLAAWRLQPWLWPLALLLLALGSTGWRYSVS